MFSYECFSGILSNVHVLVDNTVQIRFRLYSVFSIFIAPCSYCIITMCLLTGNLLLRICFENNETRGRGLKVISIVSCTC